MATRRSSRRATAGGKRRDDSPREPLRPLTGQAKGQQLQELLEDLVSSSEPGDKLPSERELAARYGVARMTARGAIDRLVSQGLVHRIHGQGTYVSEPRVAQPASLTSFTEDMVTRDMTPSSIVLAQEVVPATGPIALQLQLAAGEPVLRLERIRRGDDDPIALERSHLPARRFPGLESVDLAARSLYETLATDYDCEPATSEQQIAAVALTDAEAHLLHVPTATPALRIERTTRARDGGVIEFVRSVYRGDRFELRTHQHRKAGTSRAEPDDAP